MGILYDFTKKQNGKIQVKHRGVGQQ